MGAENPVGALSERPSATVDGAVAKVGETAGMAPRVGALSERPSATVDGAVIEVGETAGR